MSDYRARIALARDAYRAAQPSPDEIRAGAARIESQLANPANHMRRLLQFLGGGALLGAGVLAVLNHAADDSGRPQEGLRASAADSAIVAANSSAGLGQPQGWMQPMQVTPDVGRTAEDPPSPGDSQDEAGGRPSSRGASTAKRSATTTKAVQSPGESKAAPPPPDWSQVSSALAAGDSPGAQRVLEGLAASGDADTRAKALLGQAQLAFSRGDRAAAKRLTRAAASVPGASAAVREKALRWAARASL
ncbi:MAG: hypothetical protein KC766_32115 [Myxococcales bacterium]|nr:hypothetical protein [Myxococcales bacterium]